MDGGGDRLLKGLAVELGHVGAAAVVEDELDLAAVELEALVEVVGQRRHGVGDRLRGVGQAGTGELGERLLAALLVEHPVGNLDGGVGDALVGAAADIGRAACSERVCQYVWISGCAVSSNNRTQQNPGVTITMTTKTPPHS